MSWAGVQSENLATVWLLYHLCDYLTPAQFKDVLSFLSMDRLPEESYSAYRRRVRDTYGIIVDDNALYEIAFKRALIELEPDLIFAGRMKEYETFFRSVDNDGKEIEAIYSLDDNDEFVSDIRDEAKARDIIDEIHPFKARHYTRRVFLVPD